MTATDLSTCEEMIMIVIWNSPTDLDLMSVLRATNDRFHTNWKPQTVSTFLTRARKKGYLSGYKQGRFTFYQPLISIEEYRKIKLITMLEQLYNNDKSAVEADLASIDYAV